jgi:DNA recombination protein RmuC
MDILFLIIGLVVGGTAAWFIAKTKFTASAQTSLQVEQEKTRNLSTDLQTVRQELQDERNKNFELNNALATIKANQQNLQKKLEEQQTDALKIQEKLTLEFKHLANEIFEEKGRKFAEQNKTNLGEILNPLKEKITDFEKKVEQSHKESLERNTAMREQLTNLKELNQQITKEAGNLTKALKGDSKTQGNWGEYILESILEKSGLVKGREYVVQESITTEDGKRLQPDVVIKLPDNKNIIIDSKVSLIAYERFISADDENDRAANLKLHIQSLRQHIRGLSDKNYQKLYSIGSLDFVLLFIPIEPAFSAAAQHDTEIFNDAFEKNIVIVSPSTLIATLRTIASIWKQEHQNKNTMEIARQATALYEKFVGFTNDLIELGNQLRRTQNSYEGAMNKLSTGSGNLVRRVEEFKKLGIQPSKPVDQRLVDKATEQSDLFES